MTTHRRASPSLLRSFVALLAGSAGVAGWAATSPTDSAASGIRPEDPPAAAPIEFSIQWPEEGEVAATFASLPAGPSGGGSANGTSDNGGWAAAPGAVWPGLDDELAWGADNPWLQWARDLSAADAADGARAERRTRLALTALDQGRHADAWHHAAAVAKFDAPSAHALLARLVPGAPAGTSIRADGGLAPLPAGVLLQPALPPPTDPPPGVLDIREIVVSGLAIGPASVSMKVGVRGDGVEVHFEHLAGEAVEFQVRVPCPAGFRTRVEYADWSRQPTVGEPLQVRLEPGAEAFRIWARNEVDSAPWSGASPEELDARTRRSGLQLRIDADDPDRPGLAAFAEAVGELLGAPCQLTTRADAPGASALTPVRIDLTDRADRPARIRALVGSLERFVLGPR